MLKTSFLFSVEMDEIGSLEVRYIERLTVQFIICECMGNVALSLSRNGYFIVIDNISRPSTSYLVSGKINFIQMHVLYLGCFLSPGGHRGFQSKEWCFLTR